MDVRRYDASSSAEWDAFVRASRTPHFLFERAFMEYHADRFVDHSLLVRDDDGGLLAVLPANRDQARVVSHGGLTFGGLLYGPDARVELVEQALRAIVSALKADGVASLVYKAVPWIYSRGPAQEDLYALHRLGARLVRRDLTSTVDLGQPAAVGNNRQRGARKALQAGITVEEAKSFGPFWDVLAKTLEERHGARPVHTLAEIELLHGRFPQSIRLFQASRQGEVLAGMVMFETPLVAHAQYIAASAAGRDLGALDLLTLDLLRRYADKVRSFDFGISTTHGGTVLNDGLVRFKESFGARGVVHDFYELDVASARLSPP